MEEESEEVVVHQAIFSHLKILSSIFWSFPLTAMSRHFAEGNVASFKLEIAIAVVAVAFALVFLYHFTELLKRVLRRLYPARVRRSLLSTSVDLLENRDTWDIIKENCSLYAMKGKRPKMEDRFSVVTDAEDGISLYGIFDGHGGAAAAEFVEKHLFPELLKKLKIAANTNPKTNAEELTKEYIRLLTEEILYVDHKLLLKMKASKDVAGTTALVALVHNNQLIVANVGDSRGVICDSKGNTIPLSFDHKPQQLKESRRIKEAGGFITFNGVWRVAGILATSRALGDFPLKDRNLVIAEPDILTFNLVDLNPHFMILATDGLWDIFTNEDAVAFIKNHIQKDPYRGAKSLSLQAYRNGSLDNITVMVVDFHNLLS